MYLWMYLIKNNQVQQCVKLVISSAPQTLVCILPGLVVETQIMVTDLECIVNWIHSTTGRR